MGTEHGQDKESKMLLKIAFNPPFWPLARHCPCPVGFRGSGLARKEKGGDEAFCALVGLE